MDKCKTRIFNQPFTASEISSFNFKGQEMQKKAIKIFYIDNKNILY